MAVSPLLAFPLQTTWSRKDLSSIFVTVISRLLRIVPDRSYQGLVTDSVWQNTALALRTAYGLGQASTKGTRLPPRFLAVDWPVLIRQVIFAGMTEFASCACGNFHGVAATLPT
jgi:hypothetical protein